MILITSLYAARQSDEGIQAAADIMARNLARKLSGERPSDRDFRAVTKLGEQIAEGKFSPIAGLDGGEIVMPYKND